MELKRQEKIEASLGEWVCLRCWRKNPRHVTLKKSFGKLKRELDIVRFIRNMRKVDFMFEVLLSNQARTIFSHSKFNSCDDQDSPSDPPKDIHQDLSYARDINTLVKDKSKLSRKLLKTVGIGQSDFKTKNKER